MALEQVLNCLLARELAVRPEEVTLELLRERRAALYRSASFQWIGTKPGLRIIGLREAEQLSLELDIFLDQFRR